MNLICLRAISKKLIFTHILLKNYIKVCFYIYLYKFFLLYVWPFILKVHTQVFLYIIGLFSLCFIGGFLQTFNDLNSMKEKELFLKQKSLFPVVNLDFFLTHDHETPLYILCIKDIFFH